MSGVWMGESAKRSIVAGYVLIVYQRHRSGISGDLPVLQDTVRARRSCVGFGNASKHVEEVATAVACGRAVGR